MGCGGSRETPDLAALAPHPTEQHSVPQLTPADLTDGLSLLAQYLNSHNRNIELAVVGGAVCTMLLGTRNTTEDIDYFNPGLQKDDINVLGRAVAYAQNQPHQPPFTSGWFNNNTTVWISPAIRPTLYQEAVQAGIIVFQKPGLTLYAAPFQYQFCAKLQRMSGGGSRTQDAGDAAAYLHEYLRRSNGSVISIDQIQNWIQQYQVNSVNQLGVAPAVKAINEAYVSTYGLPAPVR